MTGLRTRGVLICAVALATLLGVPLMAAQEDARQDASGETVYNVRDPGVKPPRGISMPQPEYSEQARRKKISGTVLVMMIVRPDGTVRDVKIKKSLEKSLDQQAIAAVQTWTFQPATKDGQPVAARVDSEVTFRIR